MPFLFLSPSTQDFNPYVTTGNEQYWMNQLADRMEPYLFASGLNVTRNDPNGSAAKNDEGENIAHHGDEDTRDEPNKIDGVIEV